MIYKKNDEKNACMITQRSRISEQYLTI